VDQPEAGVVTGLFVFGAGVAEADDEADGHGGTQSVQKKGLSGIAACLATAALCGAGRDGSIVQEMETPEIKKPVARTGFCSAAEELLLLCIAFRLLGCSGFVGSFAGRDSGGSDRRVLFTAVLD